MAKETFDFDLFVIGGGSGGIRAARLTAELGYKVGLAEQDRLGGTCVIRGCVPKKLMVIAADFSSGFEAAGGYGWNIGGGSFDLQAFQQRKDAEIERLEGIYRRNLNRAGVQLFAQSARLEDAHTIGLADGRTVAARYVLVATGGEPFKPDIPGAHLALTSNDVFEMQELPERLVVCGGGYIACEFAGIFNGMGSEVTLFYRGPQILRGFDEDIRNHVSEAMKARGVDVRLNTNLASISRANGKLEVATESGDSAACDAVLMATGRRPNTRTLNLEPATGMKLDPSGAVPVDGYSQSSVPSVFAVGDVTDRLNLTPVAIREAAAFVATVFEGSPTRMDHSDIPTAVFSRPEIGTVGLTEEAAAGRGPITVYLVRFRPLTYALAGRQEQYLMKLVADRDTGRLLGIHIVGDSAAEMIQLAGVALKMGARKEDFDRTVAVHPVAAEELVTMTKPVRST
ncbi:MAG: glutathione-disulfide reductase [Rhodobacteraceae bacterium]|nr:glutathione-disulfide reductase [Paracoccaceae bacterium]